MYVATMWLSKKVTVPSVVLLLLLVLGKVLSVLSDYGDSRCDVPTYPENVTVLLDSWKYYTLLQMTSVDENETVWTTYTLETI